MFCLYFWRWNIFLLAVCRWRGDDHLMFRFHWNFWHWWECAWFSLCRIYSRFDYTLLAFSSDLWHELVCFPMQLCVERLCFWWKGCWLRRNRRDVVHYYFEHHEQNFHCNCHWHAVWSFFLLWRSSTQSKIKGTCFLANWEQHWHCCRRSWIQKHHLWQAG